MQSLTLLLLKKVRIHFGEKIEFLINLSPFFVFTECFEFHINEKVVYSVRQLKDWPNFDELYEVTYWMHKVTHHAKMNQLFI